MNRKSGTVFGRFDGRQAESIIRSQMVVGIGGEGAFAEAAKPPVRKVRARR
ncbi:MAG: hypothetical protein AABN34_20525 [Acidobacteriota bacterium]